MWVPKALLNKAAEIPFVGLKKWSMYQP
jgi:hypothetical protein